MAIVHPVLSRDTTRRNLVAWAIAGGLLASVIPLMLRHDLTLVSSATPAPGADLSDAALVDLWGRAGLLVKHPGAGTYPAPTIAFPSLGNPIGHSLVHLDTGEPFPNFGVLDTLLNPESNGRNSYRFAAQVLYAGYSTAEVMTSDGVMAGVILHGLMFWGDPRYGTPVRHTVDFALWWRDNGIFAPATPVFTLKELGAQRPTSRVREGGGAGTPVDDVLEALEPHRYGALLELAVGGAWDYSLDHIAITDEMNFPTDLYNPDSLEQTSDATGELYRNIVGITLEVARDQGFGLRMAGSEEIEAITDAHINAAGQATLAERLEALPSAAPLDESGLTLDQYNDLPLLTEVRGHTFDRLTLERDTQR
jgi:hypothetical protein